MSGKTVQFLNLPIPPAFGGLKQPILKPLKKRGTFHSHPLQDVHRQLPIMGAGFHKLDGTSTLALQPT